MKSLDEFVAVNLDNVKAEVPKLPGVCIWQDRQAGEVVYVGVGVGKSGLYNRICNQHLNPRYLEFRQDKLTTDDGFQLEHAVRQSVTDGIGSGIDKSSLRRAIGRSLKLMPGEETCQYILDNLQLKILTIENEVAAKELARALIKEHRPRYNHVPRSK